MRQIPNLLTLINLLMGFLSLVFAGSGLYQTAGLFIMGAAVFDLLDGLAARLLAAQTQTGKQLDSLSDMVSFGAAPAYLMYHLIERYPESPHSHWAAFLSVAIAVAAALRLARFNIDSKQQQIFLGLPTPATGLFIAALPFAINSFSFFRQQPGPYLITLTLALPMLNLIPLKMMSLKFTGFSWPGMRWQLLLLMAAIPVLVIWQLSGIPLVIAIYLIISMIRFYLFRG